MKALALGATICISMVFTVEAARASSLISGDDAVFGVDSVTIDTATGLEWLDWTLSTNKSYVYVSTQFGPGGDFEGWRHATTAELAGLFLGADITHVDDYESNPVGVVEGLLALGGDTFFGPYGYHGTYMVTATPWGENQTLAAVDPDGLLTAIVRGAFTTFTDYSATSQSPGIGNALVRESTLAVPEPSTIALLAVGLIGISGYAPRKRRQWC